MYFKEYFFYSSKHIADFVSRIPSFTVNMGNLNGGNGYRLVMYSQTKTILYNFY